MRNNVHRLQTSFMCVVGMDDRVVSSQAAIEFCGRSTVEDKEVVVYEDLRHSVTLEPEYDDILAKAMTWASARLLGLEYLQAIN